MLQTLADHSINRLESQTVGSCNRQVYMRPVYCQHFTVFFAHYRRDLFVSALQYGDQSTKQVRRRFDLPHGFGREGGYLALGSYASDGNGAVMSSLANEISLEEIVGIWWYVSFRYTPVDVCNMRLDYRVNTLGLSFLNRSTSLLPGRQAWPISWG